MLALLCVRLNHFTIRPDAYVGYSVVEFVGSTSEKATIPIFRRVFDTYGVPKEIKSDNGSPFNSHKFEEYA